jgi:hypothetical protein
MLNESPSFCLPFFCLSPLAAQLHPRSDDPEQDNRAVAKEVGVKNPAEENDPTATPKPAFHIPKPN